MRSVLAILMILVSVGLAWAQPTEAPLKVHSSSPGEPPAVYGGPPEEVGLIGPEGEADDGFQDRFIPPRVLLKDEGLSQEQKKKLAAEAFPLVAKINLLKAELDNLKMEKMVIQNLEELNPAKLKDSYEKIAGIEADIYLARRDYIQKVNSVLTADQLERLVNSTKMFKHRRKGERR